MRRQFAALLVGLCLVSPVMAGCGSATEPSFDDEFQAWVGTWVAADARFEITVQISRGAPYRSCTINGCRDYADLLFNASLSDAATGYATSGTSLITAQGFFGSATELQVHLIDREVVGTTGVKRITYTYQGTLQGAKTTGNIVVMRYDNLNGNPAPISTETFPVMLTRQ